MRLLVACLVAGSLYAQDAPVPHAESSATGSMDIGYRWRSNVGGSLDTYRSVVNLGSGVKLIAAEFAIEDPSKRLFDKLNMRAVNLGDEPSAWWHADASKRGRYRLTLDHRDIAYYNNMPSYANPFLSPGGLGLNQQSFDIHRRLGNFDLDLLPSTWFTPYLAYSRSSGSGSGVMAFVADANEYAVPSRLRDSTSQFRGGVRIDRRRFHATMEQGGIIFRDDQNLFATGGLNRGNRTTLFLGNTLVLNTLNQDTGIRGRGFYSKGIATISAASWLDLYGQFLYSQPSNDVNYSQSNTGRFVALNPLLFFNSQQYVLSAQAKLPHTSTSVGAELRPLRRLRIVESWLSDRLDQTGSTLAPQSYKSELVSNYNRQQLDVFFDPISRLTLRGGYRRTWGDGSQFLLPSDTLNSGARGRFSQNTGLAGVTFRGGQKFTASADLEVGVSNDVYFRTSLHDFQKVRARVRYQLTASLDISANFAHFKNDNPTAGTSYRYQSNQASASLSWLPQGGKRWGFQASYDRSTLRSQIGFLLPQDLTSATSSYRDNAHSVGGSADLSLPRARFSFGGSAFISSGSRPTAFYQPLGKVLVPIRKAASFFAEWTYYGFGESFYQYESFRTHLLMTGLRFTR